MLRGSVSGRGLLLFLLAALPGCSKARGGQELPFLQGGFENLFGLGPSQLQSATEVTQQALGVEHAIKTLPAAGFPASRPGAEPWGGIAGPVPLSPAAGGLHLFKFIQADALTGDETLWKVGCSCQWDPLEKALPWD